MITYEESKKIQLTKNFMLSEYLKSTTANRLKIDNALPTAYLKRIQYHADNVLQPIRDQFGPLLITSGWRCFDLAPFVGSTIRSYHSMAYATDFKMMNRDIKLANVGIWIMNNLPYDELIFEYLPNGWIHIAIELNGGSKRKTMIKERGIDYKVITYNDAMLYLNGKII